MGCSEPPDTAVAALLPRPDEGEGSATGSMRRGRIAYPRSFLLSVAGSVASRDLPAGVDASALSEMMNQAAPPARWDASSPSGSGNCQGDLPAREPDQLDMHPGNQFKHSLPKPEHDGLLGSGAFPRPPRYVGPLAANDLGSGYQLNRNSGRYQPPRPYKVIPVPHKNVDSVNDETFGSSSECSNEDRVEEERKRRESFELMRKEQHKALQEKKNAPDCDRENLGDGIISLVENSAGKGGPRTRTDEQVELNASSCSKDDAVKTPPLLPTPKTRPLKPPGFSKALPEKRLQLQSSNSSSLNSESRQRKTDDIMVSPVPESSKCAKHEGSGHAEHLSSKKLLSMIVKDENIFADNMVRGPSASGGTSENLSTTSRSNCESGSKLCHFISPAPVVQTLEKSSTDGIPESVPVVTCGDLEVTMLAHVSGPSNSNQQTTSQKCQTVLDEPRAGEQIAVDKHSSHPILSLLQKGTTSKDSSPLQFHMGPADKLPSSDPNGMVKGGTTASDLVSNTEIILTLGKNMTLEPLFGASFTNGHRSRDSPVSVLEDTAGGLNSSSKRLPFSAEGTIPSLIPDDHSKDSALHMKKGAGVEHGNTKFSAFSSWEGASVGEEGLGMQLPEEDDLFSVNDSLHADNTHNLPYAGSARADSLLTAKEVADLSNRFRSSVPAESEQVQVLGHDMPRSSSHDQVDPNNLYQLFGSSSSATFPIESAITTFQHMDHIFNQNQQVPFSMPEAIHHSTNQNQQVPFSMPEAIHHGTNQNQQVPFIMPEAIHHGNHQNQLVPFNIPEAIHRGSRQNQQVPFNIPESINRGTHQNQQVPFNIPEAIHRGTRSFPQDINSMQHVLPARGGHRVDPVAHHRMLQRMNMPGSFPPQGLPRGVPLSQPVQHRPDYRAEVNSLEIRPRPRQPGYGESMLMRMTGSAVGANHVEALESLIQMELRARQRHLRPAMVGPVQGFYRPELNRNFRY
ncbi:uncharacterized protein LOC100825004 [Brachypodium distachyon]|uniref:Uncharacterized protein n=1 Tax=Brachypodium distachyon TaxID=15368 RepID=A0A0Q3EZD5_BRADI|nr:uncharacterized protein LOC100825004 [Brachypodium distachyon]KQJ92791.1 hypothetical protein BRADI_3g00710v3 [Brachypodium distachyon]|eukprot:XP_010233659.1 uncharacterized protein LOC100825004 [Brachypodium distachyon]